MLNRKKILRYKCECQKYYYFLYYSYFWFSISCVLMQESSISPMIRNEDSLTFSDVKENSSTAFNCSPLLQAVRETVKGKIKNSNL